MRQGASAEEGRGQRHGLWLAVLASAIACACGANLEAPTTPRAKAAARAPAAPSSVPPARDPIRLAFVTNNPSVFWRRAEAGLHAYENEAHVRIDMKMPPNGTVEEQNRILQELSRQGYDAIAVNVVSPTDQRPVLDRVAEQTNLITFDSDAEQSKRLLHIGTDNFEAGRVLGDRVTQLLPQGGKIAVFVGAFATPTRRSAWPESSPPLATMASRSSTSAKTTPTAPGPSPTSKR